MKTNILRLNLLVISTIFMLATGILNAAGLHHTLNVSIEPKNSLLTVTDTIKLTGRAHNSIIFELNHALEPSSDDDNVLSLQAVSDPNPNGLGGDGTAVFHRYLLKLKNTNKAFTISYSGAIDPSVSDDGQVIETTGVINQDGVFLARSSRWYPVFSPNESMTFDMSVSLPQGWQTMSQGKLALGEKQVSDKYVTFSWQEKNPQEEIYLIAAKFHAFQQQTGKVQALVYLRDQDQKLAQKYLDATGQYIEMYNRLLGEYPYEKFAMVENFWETGYGMPSFTLLGSKVLRFPFILYTSYPHEILHNWWGNGVYVDYDSGNWAEGLTAYLADHLMQEQRGQARLYRRGILQKYTDYVGEDDDFPLSQFRSRHNAESAAIGYGKTAMLFHMLRLELGERVFVKSLRQLYKDHRFKKTRFSDIQRIFSVQSGRDLKPFFYQWTQRKGAPQLSVLESSLIHNSKDKNKRYELSMTLAQTQPGTSYRLYVPISISFENSVTAFKTAVILTDKEQTFTLPLERRATRIDVDPGFDVFRRLHVSEIPSALSQGYGADRPLFVMPSKASKALLAGYYKMAEKWKKDRNSHIDIIMDSDIQSVPSDRTVWLLGWENTFWSDITQVNNAQIKRVAAQSINIAGKKYSKNKHSILFTARQPQNNDFTLLWLATNNVAAIPGLTRKLPHYGKYSYLAFEGDEPTNISKGQWQLGDSPMVKLLDKNATAPMVWAARTPLINLPPVFSKQRMMDDVRYLASEELKGRELGSVQLDQAADYISKAFKHAGLQPGGDNGTSYFQSWTQDVGKAKGNIQLKNVIAVLPGSNASLKKQSLIISAHYDHLGLGWPDVHAGDAGKIHPGADDNASGVAVMLELARQIAKKWRPERSIVFVAFTGEESRLMGSAHYIRHAKRFPAKQVFSILNLDMVGRLENNALSIFGVGTASELTHVFRGISYVTGIKLNPINGDIGSSDQKRFIDIGVPGVQFFSKAHPQFHRPTDTVEKIDAAGLVKVATVLKEAAEYLANRIEPLHVTIKNPQLAKPTNKLPDDKNRTSRRVRLGTIPDFSYQGKGVRIDGVSDNSPAAKAGLKKGDVLLRINAITIADLAGMSAALKTLSAGEEVKLVYRREGKVLEIVLTLARR